MIWLPPIVLTFVAIFFLLYKCICWINDLNMKVRSLQTGLYSLEEEMYTVRHLQGQEIKRGIMTARDPKEKP
jgi:chloramphenicol O-acetyltransferase